MRLVRILSVAILLGLPVAAMADPVTLVEAALITLNGGTFLLGSELLTLGLTYAAIISAPARFGAYVRRKPTGEEQ